MYLLLALRMTEPGAVCSACKGLSATQSRPAKTAGEDHQAPEPPETRQMIVEAYEAMKHQDHFKVLGVNATTTPAELKKTYFRLAKMYHPDRHLEPDMADMKEKLEPLFGRVTEAYQTLSNEGRPAEYEKNKSAVEQRVISRKSARKITWRTTRRRQEGTLPISIRG